MAGFGQYFHAQGGRLVKSQIQWFSHGLSFRGAHFSPVCRQLTNSVVQHGVLPKGQHYFHFQLKCPKMENQHRPFPSVKVTGNLQNRFFQTSSRRCVPPIFWVFIKPVAKLGAILSGRTARLWWRALPGDKRRHFIRNHWHWFAGAGAGLVVAGLVYYETHLEKTPFTGRERFIVVTHEQFEKIAQSEAQMYLERYADDFLPHSDPLVQSIVNIGQRLLRANPEAQKLLHVRSWEVFVIDDPKTINAFVMPTGQIFVFTGIIRFAENADQLAIVLAHEMAHAMLSHGIETVSYAQLLDFTIIAAMAAIWCILPTDGLALVTQWFHHKFIDIMLHMPYSRKLEKEADKVGLELAARACYDVREGSVFWHRMHIEQDVLKSDESVPEWLSTHPSNKSRTEFLDFLLPKALEIRKQEGQCPNLPSKDPREAIKELSAVVDDHVTAKRAGQNLARVQQRVG